MITADAMALDTVVATPSVFSVLINVNLPEYKLIKHETSKWNASGY